MLSSFFVELKLGSTSTEKSNSGKRPVGRKVFCVLPTPAPGCPCGSPATPSSLTHFSVSPEPALPLSASPAGMLWGCFLLEWGRREKCLSSGLRARWSPCLPGTCRIGFLRLFSRIVECTVAPCSPGLGEGFFWQEGQLTAPHRVATDLCPCKERELVFLKTGFAVSRG